MSSEENILYTSSETSDIDEDSTEQEEEDEDNIFAMDETEITTWISAHEELEKTKNEETDFNPMNENLPVLTMFLAKETARTSIQEFMTYGMKQLSSLPYPDTSSSFTIPNEICRICHGDSSSSTGLGALVAPCHCRGSVALVHMNCLERWLNESGSEECELCGYQFKTERSNNYSLMECLKLWLISSADIKQLILDFIWLMMMTPLALFAFYMGIITTHIIFLKGTRETHWTIVLLLFTSSLTILTYYGWVTAVAKNHIQSWHRWQRLNSSIRIINLASETNSNVQEINTTN